MGVSMIERVARALQARDDRWGRPRDVSIEYWEALAYVAIAAMRGPTLAMHGAAERAVRDKLGGVVDGTGVVPIETELSFDAYQAAIDAALNESDVE